MCGRQVIGGQEELHSDKARQNPATVDIVNAYCIIAKAITAVVAKFKQNITKHINVPAGVNIQHSPTMI